MFSYMHIWERSAPYFWFPIYSCHKVCCEVHIQTYRAPMPAFTITETSAGFLSNLRVIPPLVSKYCKTINFLCLCFAKLLTMVDKPATLNGSKMTSIYMCKWPLKVGPISTLKFWQEKNHKIKCRQNDFTWITLNWMAANICGFTVEDTCCYNIQIQALKAGEIYTFPDQPCHETDNINILRYEKGLWQV